MKEYFSNLVKAYNTFCIEMAHAWYHFVTKKQTVTGFTMD